MYKLIDEYPDESDHILNYIESIVNKTVKFTNIVEIDEVHVENCYYDIKNCFIFIKSLLNQKNNAYNDTLNFDRLLTKFKYFYNAFELDACWYDKGSDAHKFKTTFKLIIKNYPSIYRNIFGILHYNIKISDKLTGDEGHDNILIETATKEINANCSIITDLIKFKNKTKK